LDGYCWCFNIFYFGISTFLFGRITVKHIERATAKEGIDPPIWDKGIGARIVAYAGIIAFPNLKRHASLVNIKATKRFTREKDKKLAWLYIFSVASFFIVLIVFYLFFESEKILR
jgi:hypothetical protein